MYFENIYKYFQSTKFIIEDGKLRPPLSAIPNFGTVNADNVIKAREEEKFSSKEDLMRFISGEVKCKPIDVVSSTIAQKYISNVFYLAKDEVQTKLIEYEHILDPKVFSTHVIILPS